MISIKPLTAIVIGLAVSFCMLGCDTDKSLQKKHNKPAYVKAVAAENMRIVEMLETTGNVVAVNSVTLEATVEGPISYCPWREGDNVKTAGQKLIEINRPLYRQEVATAKALLDVAQAKLSDLKAGARPEEIKQAMETVRHYQDCTDFARADLERVRSLVTSGALPAEMEEMARVSYVECHTKLESSKELLAMLKAGPTKTEIAVALAEVDEAASRVHLAQAKLDECILRAPFAGVITEVFVRPGDLATPRTKLLKMMDPSSLVVRIGLPESSAAAIRAGTKAEVRLDAFPEKVFNARIDRIYPRLELGSRTRIIEIKIIEPVTLIPGLFARVSVQGRIIEDAIVIPDAAVVTTHRGQKMVYVVKDGKANRQPVTLGLEQGDHVQITDGILTGDTVITEGNLNLKDQMLVRLDEPVQKDINKSKQGSMQ